MCWPSKSTIQAASSVETARKEVRRVITASSVVRSGVINVSFSILEFFCKICEVGICNASALTDHEGHAKMLLEGAANERKLMT